MYLNKKNQNFYLNFFKKKYFLYEPTLMWGGLCGAGQPALPPLFPTHVYIISLF